MRNRMLNNSKEATSHEKKRVADVGKFLLAADVEVTTLNFADMPLSSDISTQADTKASSVANFVTKQADASDLQAEGMEIRRFKINRARDDTLSFKRNAGDARRGNPTRPVLSRALAVERCALVRDAIIEDSTVDTIIYEDGIDGNTVARFIAPAFLKLLSKYEKKGFEFFAEVWVTTIEDTLELLKTSGIGSWRHQVKHTLIEKLESDGASEASKNNTAAICPQYRHRQGSEVRCCKSKVPETLTVVASAMQELPSLPPTPNKQVEPSKCQQSSKNFKRRRLRTDKKSQQELHDNWNEYKGICDTEILSEDEDCNAIVVRLPEVYSKARDFFRSSTGSYGEPYKHAHVLSGAKQRKQNTRSSDGLKYRDKGMNPVKDTAEVQRKKVAIVEERLQTFHDYGYVSDSGKLRGGLKTVSRLASREVEMMDKDEGDHRI
ncbi:hypothetical protein AA0112_g2944 [Alternaria arborescens]|nr:hypothetical protein AA0112_g2944 [Alternaria arborescens]